MTDIPDWWGYEMPWTKEEETYLLLHWEARDAWSEVGRTLLKKAEGAAWNEFWLNYYIEESEDLTKLYDEIAGEVRLACAKLTGRDLELFKTLARAARLVAASIDPAEDDRRDAPYVGYEPNPCIYYRLLSELLCVIWIEGITERRRQAAAHEQKGEMSERTLEELLQVGDVLVEVGFAEYWCLEARTDSWLMGYADLDWEISVKLPEDVTEQTEAGRIYAKPETWAELLRQMRYMLARCMILGRMEVVAGGDFLAIDELNRKSIQEAEKLLGEEFFDITFDTAMRALKKRSEEKQKVRDGWRMM